MASAVASGIPFRATSLQLLTTQDRQVSAKGVQGAVNCLVQKSNLGNPFPVTSIRRRRARQSSSNKTAGDKVNKLKVTAGAESSGDLEGEESEESSMKQSALNFLHRRELLWAATGTFSYLSSPSAGIAQSAPVPPSDMNINRCSRISLNSGRTEFCCLPDGSQIQPIRFQFENLPMRTRRPAHILSNDRGYVQRYNEAYRRMRALPDNDPRSFRNQWRVHCAFCMDAYLEPGNTSGLPLQYHFNWAFLPWHRMYLYFHERILGDLIGDPTFALPFWNWDNQRPGGGNQMPRMYTDNFGNQNILLRDAIRNTANHPPVLVRLGARSGNPEVIITENLSILHRAVVSTTAADLFLGGRYTANQMQKSMSPGSCEIVHNELHIWTGSPRSPDNEDMGTFAYAGRDPIFFAHHANVDRLWSVWRNLPDEATPGGTRPRQESFDPNFRNARYAFYDHQRRLVHVTVTDTLDTSRLRYQYETMASDSDWINFRTRSSGVPKPSQEDIEPFAETTPILIKDEPKSFRLIRREATDAETKPFDKKLRPEDLEETLLIKGVKVPNSKYFAYKVFVNLPSADENTPLDLSEFVGVITHIPHAGAGGHDHSSVLDFRLSIGAAMKTLELPVGESVSVTFVPENQEEDVPFDGLGSEWR